MSKTQERALLFFIAGCMFVAVVALLLACGILVYSLATVVMGVVI